MSIKTKEEMKATLDLITLDTLKHPDKLKGNGALGFVRLANQRVDAGASEGVQKDVLNQLKEAVLKSYNKESSADEISSIAQEATTDVMLGAATGGDPINHGLTGILRRLMQGFKPVQDVLDKTFALAKSYFDGLEGSVADRWAKISKEHEQNEILHKMQKTGMDADAVKALLNAGDNDDRELAALNTSIAKPVTQSPEQPKQEAAEKVSTEQEAPIKFDVAKVTDVQTAGVATVQEGQSWEALAASIPNYVSQDTGASVLSTAELSTLDANDDKKLSKDDLPEHMQAQFGKLLAAAGQASGKQGDPNPSELDLGKLAATGIPLDQVTNAKGESR